MHWRSESFVIGMLVKVIYTFSVARQYSMRNGHDTSVELKLLSSYQWPTWQFTLHLTRHLQVTIEIHFCDQCTGWQQLAYCRHQYWEWIVRFRLRQCKATCNEKPASRYSNRAVSISRVVCYTTLTNKTHKSFATDIVWVNFASRYYWCCLAIKVLHCCKTYTVKFRHQLKVSISGVHC